LGNSGDADRPGAFGAATVRGTLFAGAGGSRLLSGNRLVSDVLVSAAGTSADDCAVPYRHTRDQHSGSSGFRIHSRSRALAEFGELAVATDPGGDSGGGLRCAHLFC